MTPQKIVKLVATGFLGLVALVTVISNIYVVDEGDRALIVRLGNIARVDGPGLNFKIPFIEDKYVYSVRTRPADATRLSAYTMDNQIVTGSLLVPYRIDPAMISEIYTKYGVTFETGLMKQIMQGVYKEAIGDVDTMKLATERDTIGATIGVLLSDQLLPFGVVIDPTTVKLANIDFSKEFDLRIAEALNEKAAVEKSRQEAKKKIQIALGVKAEAKGAADAIREQADGERYRSETVAKGNAKAIVLNADAEAHKITVEGNAQAAALKARAQASTPELTNLLRAEASLKWDGALPTRFIPGSALPLLDVMAN